MAFLRLLKSKILNVKNNYFLIVKIFTYDKLGVCKNLIGISKMLSQFIMQLRKQNGLTQAFVAEKLNMSRPTYIQFENGDGDLTISEAKQLAVLFNMTLNDLLNEKQDRISFEIIKDKNIVKKEKTEIRISVPQQQISKFKQILLYILKKVGGKPNVGMTVVYKLLYFIDFDYYEKYEVQLIGLKYIKNHFGPTPVVFEKIIQEMIDKNEIELIKSKFYRHEQKKYLVNPAIEPNLNVISGQEMEHIDWELNRLSDMNANALSELSHKDVPL